MKMYITADTHYNHQQVIVYCKRPELYEELLFKNMQFLKSSDCLIHLGDFCLGKESLMHEKYLQPLKCRKILVLGNHDSKSFSWYMEHGWDFVCDSFRLKYCGKQILFSHAPQMWDGVWEINVHGHFHNCNHRVNEAGTHTDFLRLYSPEYMNYIPIELSKLIQSKNVYKCEE